MEGAAPKSTSAGQGKTKDRRVRGSDLQPPSATPFILAGQCLECASKLHKLSTENLKLRQKLDEVAARRDHYARLYYEALAELESYKHRIDLVVNDLEDLGLTRGRLARMP